MKAPKIDKEKVIEAQIKDMESFGIVMNDQQRRYVNSCMNLVWVNANREGWWEAFEGVVQS